MDFRSTPCVFLGYSSRHHGYRCYDYTSNREYIVRHCRFDETVFPYKTLIPTSLSLPSHSCDSSPWTSAPTIISHGTHVTPSSNHMPISSIMSSSSPSPSLRVSPPPTPSSADTSQNSSSIHKYPFSPLPPHPLPHHHHNHHHSHHLHAHIICNFDLARNQLSLSLLLNRPPLKRLSVMSLGVKPCTLNTMHCVLTTLGPLSPLIPR